MVFANFQSSRARAAWLSISFVPGTATNARDPYLRERTNAYISKAQVPSNPNRAGLGAMALLHGFFSMRQKKAWPLSLSDIATGGWTVLSLENYQRNPKVVISYSVVFFCVFHSTPLFLLTPCCSPLEPETVFSDAGRSVDFLLALSDGPGSAPWAPGSGGHGERVRWWGSGTESERG